MSRFAPDGMGHASLLAPGRRMFRHRLLHPFRSDGRDWGDVPVYLPDPIFRPRLIGIPAQFIDTAWFDPHGIRRDVAFPA
jgi:hypothetical protein